MYAIIATDGKQIRVEAGQELNIDYRGGKNGDKIVFDNVVAFGGDNGLKIGKDVGGAKVSAEIVGTVQGPKLIVQKYFRRRHWKRRNGHRQLHNRVKIVSIDV